MIKIRKFEETDITDIINLYKQVSIQHSDAIPDIFKKHSNENIIEVLKKVISNEDNMIFVAEEGKVIGMLIVKLKEVKDHINLQDSKVLWIDDLIIDEASRKNGIGKLLMNEAKTIASKNNCSRLELNVWDFNKNAIGFYEHLGMKCQRNIMEIEIGG